jgi:hypothetical protein
MANDPTFRHTPKLLEMEAKLAETLDQYLRELNRESHLQEPEDPDDQEHEPIGPDFIMTAWCMVAEYQHMDPDVRPIVIGAQPRSTTPSHAHGLATYWYAD